MTFWHLSEDVGTNVLDVCQRNINRNATRNNVYVKVLNWFAPFKSFSGLSVNGSCYIYMPDFIIDNEFSRNNKVEVDLKY